jgi:HEAT repeat protein
MHWWHVQKLKSKDAKARLDGLHKLAKEENPANIDIFIGLLSDADPGIRAEAARELAKFQDERVSAPLIRLLTDPVPEVREAAVTSLRSLSVAAAIPGLRRLLKDPDGRVRYRAGLALESLGWSAENPEEQAQWLVALGRPDRAAYERGAAVGALIFGLKNTTGYKRQEMVNVLAEIDDPRVVKPLIDALRDSDANVRSAVVEALGRLRDARAIDPLIVTLKDKESRVRSSAIEALTRIGDAKAVPAIAKCLKDPAWDVRIAATQALGKLKDASVVDPLVDCLKDKDRDLRQAAANALGSIGHPRAIPALVQSLTDEQESVRSSANVALRKIDAEWETSPLVKMAIPSLHEAARSSVYWVRQSAVTVLARLNPDQPATQLEHETTLPCRGTSSSDRFQAYDALITLGRLEDRDFRQAAAEALGRLGDRRATKQLFQSLDDQDEWVRVAAANSLQTMQWEPADPEQQARHLVALGHLENAAQLKAQAREPLLKALASARPSIRARAATALATVDPAGARSALMALLQDESELVREAVATALAGPKSST